MKRLAVIGAGLSGLTIANELGRKARVTVFEKSRGVGGRMATRYADPYHFDHGAQFFTAKTKAFEAFVRPLVEQGVLLSWNAAFAELDRDRIVSQRQWDAAFPHYVAAPGMNLLGKHLSESVDLRLGQQVAAVKCREQAWQLVDQQEATLGTFDWVISTAPAQQTARLMPPQFSRLGRVKGIHMVGCYALMLGFRGALSLPWQAALVRNADISWISVNNSKPGRPKASAIVVHATNAWSEAHMEENTDAVREHLLREWSDVTGIDPGKADFCDVQRWRYANVGKQDGEKALVDEAHKLAACGDWCVRGRVEAAFSSARELVRRLSPLL